MSWVEFIFKLKVDSSKDILIAKLASLGFDSFDETHDDLKAYIDKEKVTNTFLELVKKNSQLDFKYLCLENKNWNVIWESNFSPILIDDQCFIRAPFHQKMNVKYDILINPKMSFGTGHHETTKMMILELIHFKERPRKVLDVGCGTAILSIVSEKLWGSEVLAIDIDQWAIENSLENININKCVNIDVEKGDIQTQKKSFKYDLILANINTNVLLKDFNLYFDFLEPNGHLIISGFLDKDFLKIKEKSLFFNFSLISQKEENKWQCVVLKKIE